MSIYALSRQSRNINPAPQPVDWGLLFGQTRNTVAVLAVGLLAFSLVPGLLYGIGINTLPSATLDGFRLVPLIMIGFPVVGMLIMIAAGCALLGVALCISIRIHDWYASYVVDVLDNADTGQGIAAFFTLLSLVATFVAMAVVLFSCFPH